MHSLSSHHSSRKVVSILLEDLELGKASFLRRLLNCYFLLCRHDFDFHPSSISVTLAVEEHKSCRCVDQNSINVTLNVDLRLREVLESQEKEKLSREIRSVAPTISNAIITTRATSSDNRGAAAGGGTDVSYSNPRRVKAGIVTNDERQFGPDGIGVKPTEHEIVYYKTCLACREQQELCRVSNYLRTPYAYVVSNLEASIGKKGKAKVALIDTLSLYSFNQSIKIFSRTTSMLIFLHSSMRSLQKKSFQYFLRALETYNTYDFTKFTSLSQSCKMRLFYEVKGKVFSVDFSWPFYVLKFLAQYWIMGGNFCFANAYLL